MENKQYDTYVLKKIQDVIFGLDELEKLSTENSQTQSKVDSEISDWLHVLQDDETLTDEAIAEIGKKLIDLRKERNSLRNAYEIMKVFVDNRSKLLHPDNRKILSTQIHKSMKNLNQPYKNRVITEKSIEELKVNAKPISNEKHRIKKNSLDLERLKELLKEGKSQQKIAKELGCSQATICNYKKALEREEQS